MKNSVLLFLTFFLSFKNNAQSDKSENAKSKAFSISGFDDRLWRKNWNACMGICNKDSMASILYCQRKKLIGMTTKEIEHFLGKPNYTFVSKQKLRYFYYLNGSFQCDTDPIYYTNIDVATLFLEFSGDKLTVLEYMNGLPLFHCE